MSHFRPNGCWIRTKMSMGGNIAHYNITPAIRKMHPRLKRELKDWFDTLIGRAVSSPADDEVASPSQNDDCHSPSKSPRKTQHDEFQSKLNTSPPKSSDRKAVVSKKQNYADDSEGPASKKSRPKSASTTMTYKVMHSGHQSSSLGSTAEPPRSQSSFHPSPRAALQLRPVRKRPESAFAGMRVSVPSQRDCVENVRNLIQVQDELRKRNDEIRLLRMKKVRLEKFDAEKKKVEAQLEAKRVLDEREQRRQNLQKIFEIAEEMEEEGTETKSSEGIKTSSAIGESYPRKFTSLSASLGFQTFGYNDRDFAAPPRRKSIRQVFKNVSVASIGFSD